MRIYAKWTAFVMSVCMLTSPLAVSAKEEAVSEVRLAPAVTESM